MVKFTGPMLMVYCTSYWIWILQQENRSLPLGIMAGWWPRAMRALGVNPHPYAPGRPKGPKSSHTPMRVFPPFLHRLAMFHRLNSFDIFSPIFFNVFQLNGPRIGKSAGNPPIYWRICLARDSKCNHIPYKASGLLGMLIPGRSPHPLISFLSGFVYRTTTATNCFGGQESQKSMRILTALGSRNFCGHLPWLPQVPSDFSDPTASGQTARSQDNKSMTGTARYASVAGSSSFELPSVSILESRKMSEVRSWGQVGTDEHCPKPLMESYGHDSMIDIQ
jgi:hypothetical protein